jgi:hypothetical protein
MSSDMSEVEVGDFVTIGDDSATLVRDRCDWITKVNEWHVGLMNIEHLVFSA